MSTVVTYRISALTRAWVCLGRSSAVVIPVIIINSVLQALLLLPGFLPGVNLAFIVAAVLSFLILVASYTVAATAILAAIEGRISGGSGVRAVLADSPARFPAVLGWSLLLLIATIIGLSLYVVPGLIVLAVLPFLLIAVIDQRRNPLAANFATLGKRWGRWLLTIVIMAVLCGVLWLLATVTGFFIGGALGALIAWLVLGVIAAWFTAAWALIYRGVTPAETHPESITE